MVGREERRNCWSLLLVTEPRIPTETLKKRKNIFSGHIEDQLPTYALWRAIYDSTMAFPALTVSVTL